MNLTKGDITFGNTYTDDVTGYTGKATALIEYMGGDVQVRLEAQRDQGVAQEWFPASRLSFAEPKPKTA